MLRRIPVTPLVYLAILLTTLFADGSWAAAPDESMEILLKPNPTSSSPIPDVNKAKPRDSHRTKRAAVYGPVLPFVPPPAVLTSTSGNGLRSAAAGCLRTKPCSHFSSTTCQQDQSRLGRISCDIGLHSSHSGNGPVGNGSRGDICSPQGQSHV